MKAAYFHVEGMTSSLFLSIMDSYTSYTISESSNIGNKNFTLDFHVLIEFIEFNESVF
jgi:hypothetical protein